jgi:hypothetical protein
MSALSPLSGVKRKSDLRADISGFDPERTFLPTGWRGAATQIGWVSPTMPAPTEAKSDGPTHPGCGPLKWQIAARPLAVY